MTSEAITIRFAHPIDPVVRAQILSELQAIEAHNDVTVLFACESGSRGWGFASTNSDYDVRFIYAHKLPWYLSVDPGRDVIEVPISGDLDINGWDLRKALQLLRRSNPILLEWLRSPIVYLENAEVVPGLRILAEQHFSEARGYYHYISMAKKNFRGYLQGDEVRYKKYLYVLRPLFAARWLREGRGAPPMRFAELAEATLTDRALLEEINRLLDIKMRSDEVATSPRWHSLHDFIESELAMLEAYQPGESHRGDAAALDAFLAHTILHKT
ncbi:MAG: nucleotidyltransferase domain-containing protein [Betaproteobacteria bacterium]|nr:nucleotidyltransferase domain-containing protein [Betaproteobacteria bacterium]